MFFNCKTIGTGHKVIVRRDNIKICLTTGSSYFLPPSTETLSPFSFLRKWANPGLFLFFSSFSHHNFNKANLKKHKWCAWDLNLRLHDGRCRLYHGAMAAAPKLSLFLNEIPLCLKYQLSTNYLFKRRRHFVAQVVLAHVGG